MGARRAMAIGGGVLFGVVVDVMLASAIDSLSNSATGLGGLVGGLGLGLMVAATVRE